MASLKEVKNRIASVNSTRKITSAMKMVSSSKLHKAQQAIENMRPYEKCLSDILRSYAGSLEEGYSSPLLTKRVVRRAAVVVMSSNSSLCGGFNNNVVKAFQKQQEDYRAAGVILSRVYTLGKKAHDTISKMNPPMLMDQSAVVDAPSYRDLAALSKELTKLFLSEEIDEVKMIYHRFVSNAKQVLEVQQYLPLALPPSTSTQPNYIVEPSPLVLLEKLFPKTLSLQLFSALLDSVASEHAARVMAMQIATDNADTLLQELTLTYNKTRQQAITTELLDLVGGSMQ